MTMKAWLIIGAEILLSFLIIYILLGQIGQESRRADAAESLAKQRQETIDDMTVRQRDVAALDAKYTQELADAKKQLDDLRRDVDSGAKRLRIAATCPGVPKATSATGVDDAGAPELTPDARRNYFDHRDGIEVTKEMIHGLHEYINTQCLK